VMPLWLALLDRQRLSWRALVGLALGFGGVALLVGPGAGSFSWPALVVVFTSLGWAAASLYSRGAPQPAPLLFAAMQMLAGGVLLFVAGGIRGEFAHLQRPTLSAGEALLYLIVVGSFVGFTAYSWLLRNARMSLVGTYAFVNPVVAVLLGWGFNNESLSLRTLVAGAVIVSGVALIVLAPAYPERRRGAQAAVPVRAR
jgi:drug/metabolite transporter (DMT)-like permease